MSVTLPESCGTLPNSREYFGTPDRRLHMGADSRPRFNPKGRSLRWCPRDVVKPDVKELDGDTASGQQTTNTCGVKFMWEPTCSILPNKFLACLPALTNRLSATRSFAGRNPRFSLVRPERLGRSVDGQNRLVILNSGDHDFVRNSAPSDGSSTIPLGAPVMRRRLRRSRKPDSQGFRSPQTERIPLM